MYFDNYHHVGDVTKVYIDKNGDKVIDFEASNTSTGPINNTAKLNGKGYWGSRIDGFGKWDTKPDKPAANKPAAASSTIVNESWFL